MFDYLNKDCNVVVATKTSTGKTVCAEIIMDTILDKKGRVIYLSPLKALTLEKYNEWMERFVDKNIEILTGDFDLTKEKIEQLNNADIICITSEMLDSKTRKAYLQKNRLQWLHNVSLLIVDEAHIIGTEERGHPAEVSLMRFCKLFPEARVLLLSATLHNVTHFVEWVTKLNNKKTYYIYSTWRPVKVDIDIIGCNINSLCESNKKVQTMLKELLKILEKKGKEKFLIFVHTKSIGYKLKKELRRLSIRCDFHNADIMYNERIELERKFKYSDSFNVLISTSTLAWGVNLPARNVVIFDVYRGRDTVCVFDIIQMIGRAGRLGLDDKGDAYIIVPNKDDYEYWNEVINKDVIVYSKLLDKYTLMFHITSGIHTKEMTNEKQINEWFSRSLASVQGNKIQSKDLSSIIQELVKIKAIIKQMGVYRSNVIGALSSVYYFHPYDIRMWCDNFNYIFNMKKDIKNEHIAWALADVNMNMGLYFNFKKEELKILERIQKVLDMDKITTTKTLYGNVACIVTLYVYYMCLCGDFKNIPQQLKPMAYTIRKDVQRIFEVLRLLDKYYTLWSTNKLIQHNFWDYTYKRMLYGDVDIDLIDLLSIDYIGKVRAEKLKENGILNRDDILNNQDILFSLFGKKAATKILENI